MFKPINTAMKKTSNPKVLLKYRCELCSSKKEKFKIHQIAWPVDSCRMSYEP